MENKIQTISSWLGAGSINVFGRPFAGKDTQGNYLANILGGVMVSSGDILRKTTDEQVQKIMAEGGIIPMEAFERIVPPFFGNPDLNGKPLILSEVGRLKGEEQIILKVTSDTNHPTKAVIYLSLSEEVVWERFDLSQINKDRGNRADDNKLVLQNRLDKYREKVIPVIEYYRDIGLLIDIDGSPSKEQVTNSIIDALYQKATIG
ncbi:MAG: nucleoside monophosphate kinase [Patescibacteria group bacterium]|jgi:adenylate kinase|nr:nucleoside monophosphate kinase [Patescibacteria group bacterium]